MKNSVLPLLLSGLLYLLSSGSAAAQMSDTAKEEMTNRYTNAYQEKIGTRLKKFDQDMSHSTSRFFKKMKRKQQALRRKWGSAADSLMKNTMPGNIASVQNKLANGKDVYLPYLDTLSSSLSFLSNINTSSLTEVKELQNLELLKEAKSKLAQVEQIKGLLAGQQEKIKQLSDKYKKAAADYLRSVSKEYYYLGQRINNYKALLSDPSKIEEHMLAILRELPAFKEFLKNNSAIAGLFNIGNNDPGSLAGLQTRSMMQAVLQERTSFSSIDGTGMVAGQLQSAKTKMDELKQKLSGDQTAGDLPDFKPKELKSKTFLQRMELGSNIKISGRNTSLPMRSELMLSAGYKFSDKISLGVGFTHWLGLGKNIENIALSHQGLGFSSYYKMQLKGKFFVSGGWEQNHFNQFLDGQNLQTQSAWKNSALLGIGKKTSLGTSFLGNKWGKGRSAGSQVTLLYDFLHKQRLPQTEALKLRFGFTF